MPLTRVHDPKHIYEVITGTFFIQPSAIFVDVHGQAWLNITAPLFKTKDDLACVAVTKHTDGTWSADISKTDYKWAVTFVNTAKCQKLDSIRS